MFRNKGKSEEKLASNGTETLNTKADQLFDALNQAKKQKRRKRIRRILVAAVVAVAALIVGVQVLQRQVRQQFGGSAAEVLSEQAARGTISTVVSGSGILLNVDTEVVSAPAGVEITEILVGFGDTVEEGALLATADMATVRTAMPIVWDRRFLWAM